MSGDQELSSPEVNAWGWVVIRKKAFTFPELIAVLDQATKILVCRAIASNLMLCCGSWNIVLSLLKNVMLPHASTLNWQVVAQTWPVLNSCMVFLGSVEICES